MSAHPTTQPSRVPAVRQALMVLRYLAKTETPMSVSMVARGTGLSPSSSFNLLRTLAEEEIVTFDPVAKTYELGFGLLEIASPLVSRDDDVLIRPLLMRIAQQHRALITLWQVINNERITLIDRMYGNSTVRIEMRLGARVPALAGAIGRCMAAVTQPRLADLRHSFASLRWQTPLSFEEFRADVERADQDGFGIDLDHWTRGVHAVGTVVLERGGTPRLCIGGLAIAGQLSLDELRSLGTELRDTARLIGRSLYGAGQATTTSALEPLSSQEGAVRLTLAAIRPVIDGTAAKLIHRKPRR
jgi:DNA-binding IclR family transcriptional regulator